MIALMQGASLAETTAFVTVVELKSFTKAAKQLALSPPRVSEMVRNLEERLGVRLVERTTRSVAPTAAGERLLERLRPVLDEYQSALESTNEFRGKPAGLLRVTAPPPAGDFFLASAIPRFLAHYPEISLDLSFADALTDIVAERFDAGIRIGERIERDMIAVRVTDELPLVVAGSPAYFAQRGKPKTPDDLVAHDCLHGRVANIHLTPVMVRREYDRFGADFRLIDGRHWLRLSRKTRLHPRELRRIHRGQLHHRHAHLRLVMDQFAAQRIHKPLDRMLCAAVGGL